MKILADTHIILWQFLDDPRLGDQYRKVLADPENQIFVSDISLWEIAIKYRTGKLLVHLRDVEREIINNDYEMLGLERAHLREMLGLERHHGDPFDHLLMAQALSEDMSFLTADRWAKSYSVQLALN